METKLKKEHFKKRYDFTCCNCGYEQWAKPSIMMAGFGRNSGHGSCLNCNEFLHLEIKGGLDGENMVSELWDDFLKILKGAQKRRKRWKTNIKQCYTCLGQ